MSYKIAHVCNSIIRLKLFLSLPFSFLPTKESKECSLKYLYCYWPCIHVCHKIINHIFKRIATNRTMHYLCTRREISQLSLKVLWHHFLMLWHVFHQFLIYISGKSSCLWVFSSFVSCPLPRYMVNKTHQKCHLSLEVHSQLSVNQLRILRFVFKHWRLFTWLFYR